MSAAESSITRGHLRRILAIAAVGLVLLLVTSVGTMAYWARAVDRMTANTEQALVERTIDRRLLRIGEDVASAAVWDDAWLAVTAPQPDMTWMDANFGEYYAEYMNHDRTVVFDAADRPIYASREGVRAPVSASAAFARAVGPLLAAIRTRERAESGTTGLGLDGAQSVSGVVRAEGAIWLVAATTVTPETARLARPGPFPVVVSARRVSPAFLTDMEKDIGIEQARLVTADEIESQPAVALTSPQGERLARLTWTPAKPGLEVLREVTPPYLLALAVLLLAAGLLAFRVNRALQALARNDRDLEATLQELTRARDRAEAASVAKSQFLANMSHEIRTPLNGVLGMAQVMERADLDPVQRGRLGVIRESGAALLALLNDVLDLAKIEAGKLEIALADTNLEAAVAAACETYRDQALEKGLAFGFVVEAEAATTWRLDGMRLTQVLGNLISNAIKFTSTGHVSVRAWRSDRGLEFAVLDTGPGIPPERAADLFGKFNQLDASTTRQFGGSGLGLAICSELVELMDGELTVESTVGVGSLFSFFLPAEPAERRAAA
ncbi:MAG: ATP-binding protein [Pseudomonadota bacterium]